MKRSRCLLMPDQYYRSISDIDFDQMYDSGIRVLLTDMDNTLTPHGAHGIDVFAKTQIARIKAAGIECVIFSNAKISRLTRFAEQSGLTYVPGPMKPTQKGIRTALSMFSGLDRRNFALIGDQIFTDIITGKNGGVLTILVDPLYPDEPPYIRFKRLLEKPVKKKCFY
ncbi:MAG: YqeG family HAD IIIA-type phosphatase [Saccharofermentanales bacterium]